MGPDRTPPAAWISRSSSTCSPLLEDKRFWVKVAGVERASRQGTPYATPSLCAQAGAGIRRSHAVGHRLAASQPGRDSRRRLLVDLLAEIAPSEASARRFSSTTHSVFINSAEKTSGSGSSSPGAGWSARAGATAAPPRCASRGRREGFPWTAMRRACARPRKTQGVIKTLCLRRHRRQCYCRHGGRLCKDLGTRRPSWSINVARSGARRTGRDERGALGCAGGQNLKDDFLLQARPAVMERQGRGVIINLASTSGLRWIRCGASGLCRDQGRGDQLSRVVAVQYASKGIRVTRGSRQLHTPMVEARLAHQRAGATWKRF